MTMKVENKKQVFEQAPEGTHVMRCYRFIDLGTHEEKGFNGNMEKRRKCQISFELPNKLTSEGKPFSVHPRFKVSFNEKAKLAKFLKSWLGKEYNEGMDLATLVGKPGLGNIIYNTGSNGVVYTNVESIMPLPEGMPIPDPVNDYGSLFLDEDFDPDFFSNLSEKTKNYIMESPEYKAIAQNLVDAVKNMATDMKKDGDEIPF